MSKDTKIDLLSGNMYRTIIRLGYPLAIGSAVQTLYNLADTFWLGKLGRSALSAPVISFNIIFFILSIGIGFSLAGTALVSQYTGSGEKERVHTVTGNLLTYLLAFAAMFVLVGLALDEEFLRLLKTPADTFAQTLDYYRIMVMGMPLAFPFFVYYSVMSGYGDTKSPLKLELLSAVINVVLDPLLIFGWLGFPALGVKGAALTTILSRGAASAVGMWLFFSGRKGIKLSLRHLKPDFRLFSMIFKIGAPAAVGMSGTSLGFLVLMGIVNRFGTPVISAYGIAMRAVHFFMMPAMGISQAVTAIVGQNLGAENIKRAKSAILKGVHLILLIIVPAMALMALGGRSITVFFIPNDPLVHQIGNTMFYIIAPSVVFFAAITVFSGAFQGAGFTVPVMVTNLSRIWLFRIPLVYLISMVIFGGPTDLRGAIGIWWGMFGSNFLGFLMIFLWYLRGTWAKARIKEEVK
jgi:putative MATE family efflux protein